MGKIPEFFRGPARSARTGINTPDRSGVIIAGAVKDLADTFFTGVVNIESKSKQLIDNSARAKAIGEYTTRYLEEADKIKSSHLDNPEKATQLLKELRSELKNEQIDVLTDRGIQQEFALEIDNINLQEDIRDVAWKIEQNTLISQKNYTDRISNDAKSAAQTSSFEEYLKKVEQFQNEEAEGNKISQAFGGLKEGQKVLDQGIEAITRGFISGKMARGESFEAAQHLLRGDFDVFISQPTKTELLKKLDQAQKGDSQRSNFIQAAEAAIDIFQTSKDVFNDNVDVVGLEEKISQTSFALVAAEQQDLSKERIGSLKKQQDLLERLRDIKLEQIETSAVDDIETKGRLLSDYQFLVDYEEGQNSLISTLDEVLDFQRKATEAFYDGRLSKATYDKWMLFTETAIKNDITEGMKEGRQGFKVPNEGGFLGLGSTNALSSSKKVRKDLQDILKNSNKALGREHAIDTLDFYLDLLNDQLGGDLSALDQMPEETHHTLVKNAKAKATLKQMGLPVYLTIGNKIPANGGLFEIVDVANDGMPIIKVKDE